MTTPSELPDTLLVCDGCGNEMNVLAPHLAVQVKAQVNVLVASDNPTDDPNDVPVQTLTLGTRSGRGVIKKFHNFDCFGSWVADRAGLPAKLEYHHEEGDPYVPEDNRTPEELVDAGELPEEMLAVYAASDKGGE